MVAVDEKPCRLSVTAAGDVADKGSDDAEDESEATHLVVECGGCLLEVVRLCFCENADGVVVGDERTT